MPTIAPWLKAPDIAGEYLRGLSIGSQVAESRARLQQQATHEAMQAQIQQQQLQQRSLEDAQRIQVSKAYHDAELGLKEQQLQQVQQLNAQKTKQAAMKLQAQSRFNQVYKETGDVQKALFASGMGTPQNVLAARKDVEDLGSQRLAQRQESLELRERQYQDKQGKTPVPRRIGEKVVTDPVSGDKTTQYMFEQPPGAAGTAPASKAKRLRWDATKNALLPIEAAAPAEETDTDQQ